MKIKKPEKCITIARDGQEVHFDHYRFGHKKVIVIAHGFFNSKSSVLLKELGAAHCDQYDVVLLDFRGHGESKGLFFWTTKEPMDLEAVLQYVAPLYERVGLIGFSLGGAISLIVSARTDLVHSLISVSAPTEFERIDYRFWELDMETDIIYNLVGDGRFGKGVRPGPFWLKKEKPIHVVPRIKVPVFYMHGEADWLIKPWHAQELYDKTVSYKNLMMIKDGPHAEYLIMKNRGETVQAIKTWWQETLVSDKREEFL